MAMLSPLLPMVKPVAPFGSSQKNIIRSLIYIFYASVKFS